MDGEHCGQLLALYFPEGVYIAALDISRCLSPSPLLLGKRLRVEIWQSNIRASFLNDLTF
ncbi:unnamed protein product [Hymenolepis diminuta]|uniref:TOBE_2 domain-containing protein n=1 Tax=Hymenolepis diminuta TaxID=6216 RepID=A0A0R3SP26_HYMDI|nr:unnamed protein product [Hymenolepis diminuta]